MEHVRGGLAGWIEFPDPPGVLLRTRMATCGSASTAVARTLYMYYM